MTTPKDDTEAPQVSHVIENGVPVDVVESQVRLDAIHLEARVQLPPFERPPEITLLPYSRPTFDETGPTPEVRNVTRNSFDLKIEGSTSATVWKWQAKGKLLAPDPARTAKKRKRGPDPWTIAGVIAGVIGAIGTVLALFLPEFRHFFHLP